MGQPAQGCVTANGVGWAPVTWEHLEYSTKGGCCVTACTAPGRFRPKDLYNRVEKGKKQTIELPRKKTPGQSHAELRPALAVRS